MFLVQLLKSRLPLRNLAFPNKFGKKIAVDQLPVQCVSHLPDTLHCT